MLVLQTFNTFMQDFAADAAHFHSLPLDSSYCHIDMEVVGIKWNLVEKQNASGSVAFCGN